MGWIRPNNKEVADKIMTYLSVLGPAACSYIRKDHNMIFDSLTGDGESFLSDRESCLLKQTEQMPITLLMLISDLLKASESLDIFERMRMEDRLVSYQIELGCLERILNQPIYTPYTRQTSRFLLVYLTFLPCSLAAYLSWACIGVMPVITFLLVGIDNIGIKCENPFLTLPIKALGASSKNTVEVVWRTREQAAYQELVGL